MQHGGGGFPYVGPSRGAMERPRDGGPWGRYGKALQIGLSLMRCRAQNATSVDGLYLDAACSFSSSGLALWKGRPLRKGPASRRPSCGVMERPREGGPWGALWKGSPGRPTPHTTSDANRDERRRVAPRRRVPSLAVGWRCERATHCAKVPSRGVMERPRGGCPQRALWKGSPGQGSFWSGNLVKRGWRNALPEW